MDNDKLAHIRSRVASVGPRSMEGRTQAHDDRVDLLAEVDRLRAELKKAQAAAYVPRGLYRNSLGAELRVSSAGEPWVATLKRAGFHVLTGDIAVATSHDDLFGTWHYLVTNASLRECGYELVEAETDAT